MPQNLKYPKKSHRKKISIPKESEELAELIGIIFGDGGVNNDWQLVISLNSISDEKYSRYVINLIKKLSNIVVFIKRRPNQNTLILICSSMNLLDFLMSKGIVKGNKIKQKIDQPKWIAKNSNFEKAFVRGLVDTDGCLYIHKHLVKGKLYSNIGFCFTSYSSKLINSVSKILRKNKIVPHITKDKYRIYLYEGKSVLQYLNIFGSSNPRIFEKFEKWRGAGAAERARLESVYNRKVIEGSNPSLSAT